MPQDPQISNILTDTQPIPVVPYHGLKHIKSLPSMGTTPGIDDIPANVTAYAYGLHLYHPRKGLYRMTFHGTFICNTEVPVTLRLFYDYTSSDAQDICQEDCCAESINGDFGTLSREFNRTPVMFERQFILAAEPGTFAVEGYVPITDENEVIFHWGLTKPLSRDLGVLRTPGDNIFGISDKDWTTYHMTLERVGNIDANIPLLDRVTKYHDWSDIVGPVTH